MHRTYRGFTIVELMMVMAVLAILATIVMVGYNGWQRRIAENAAKSDLTQAANLLKNARNFKGVYPTSLYSNQISDDSKPQFQPSSSDIVTLNYHTNATTHPVYQGMSEGQKLVLFIDVCKSVISASQPASLAQTYHNSCTVSNLIGILGLGGLLGVKLVGDKIGTIQPVANGGKMYINNNFTVQCGWGYGLLGLQPCTSDPIYSDYSSKMSSVVQEIKNRYIALGGTFPIEVPLIDLGFSNPPSLPAPTQISDDNATKYCLEAISVKYGNFIYHVKSSSPGMTANGACPTDEASW